VHRVLLACGPAREVRLDVRREAGAVRCSPVVVLLHAARVRRWCRAVSDAPAGWYPDPTPATAVPSVRYWDGLRWTEHVAGAAPTTTPMPYAAPPGPTTPDGVPLAGWWWRVLAYLIDFLPIWVVAMVVSLPQQAAMQDEMNRLTEELAETGDTAAFWDGWLAVMGESQSGQWPLSLLVLAYFLVMLRWKGATLGKLAVGLRVRRRDEPGRLPWSTVLVRVAAYNGVGLLPVLAFSTGSWAVVLIVWPLFTIYMLLDVLWPLWDKKRQALHDKIARTNVVKVR
jgi:uncharacterized RDD family membrane protein YckC